MLKEDFNIGGSTKYALEGRDPEETQVFLDSLGLRNTVTLHSVHPDCNVQWTGGRFDKVLPVLDRESVVKAKGSGCLRIKDGNGSTVIFLDKGEIVKEQREESKAADPNQWRMNI